MEVGIGEVFFGADLDGKFWWIGFGLEEVVDVREACAFAFGWFVLVDTAFDEFE